MRAGCNIDISFIRRVLDCVCQEIHEDLLQAALITNDAVFEQTTEILGDLYVSIRVLELNKLDDFIQNILHHEVIAILGNLAVFE